MNDSRLLIDDEPLLILPKLAEKIGLNEAIILQQIHYWNELNKEKNNNKNFHEGCYWTFNSYEKWKEQNFKWMSISTIRRTIAKLEKQGLLIVGNFNKKKYDKTKWYRVNYDLLDSLFQEEENPLFKMNRPTVQNEQTDCSK